MAELTASGDRELRPIPAHAQLLAVAWLRWRMFVNSFRRTQTGKGKVTGLLLTILLRLIIWPIFAIWVIGPVVGCGILAWLAVAHHHPENLVSLLAGVIVAWQFLSINGLSVAANSSNFDPASLVRFPLPFGRYLLLRTLVGLLTPSTVVGCLALLAAAIGIGIADLRLLFPAMVVLAVYALMNIFFTRMLAAWLDRWLATRRAREVFGALMAVLVLSVQLLNFRHGGHSRGSEDSLILNISNGTNHFLDWFPPGFAAHAIVQSGYPLAAIAQFIALMGWTALFLAIFAIRLHKQFLGELLSEGPVGSSTITSATGRRRSSRPSNSADTAARPERDHAVFSPVISACLRKEWIYLRGNANMIIGMLTPLFFVVILSKGVFASHPRYFLPGALGYVLLGLLAPLYNVFGADAGGVQLYLLAPIRLRDVILAKNILSLTLVFAETALAWILVLTLAKDRIPLATNVAAAFWIIFVIGANLSLGTLRSIQAPRKFIPGQTRQMRSAPTNRTSGLLVVALLLGSILLQVPVTLLCRHFGQPWLATVIFAPLAAAAAGSYVLLLRRAEELVLSHRDLFAQELCGV